MLGKMLNVVEVFKAFEQGEKKIKVLESLNLSVANGEKVAILGQSGSGKSTLLTLLAGLDHPDSGSISINNQNLSSFKEDELSKFSLEKCWYYFSAIPFNASSYCFRKCIYSS